MPSINDIPSSLASFPQEETVENPKDKASKTPSSPMDVLSLFGLGDAKNGKPLSPGGLQDTGEDSVIEDPASSPFGPIPDRTPTDPRTLEALLPPPPPATPPANPAATGWLDLYKDRQRRMSQTSDPALKGHFQAELDVARKTLEAMGVAPPGEAETPRLMSEPPTSLPAPEPTGESMEDEPTGEPTDAKPDTTQAIDSELTQSQESQIYDTDAPLNKIELPTGTGGGTTFTIFQPQLRTSGQGDNSEDPNLPKG